MADNQKISSPKFNVPKFEMPKLQLPIINTSTYDLTYIDDSLLDELNRSREEAEEAEREYKDNVLSALRQIEKNTANLSEIVSLLHSNNDKQTEIFDIIIEMLSIAKEKDKTTAQSRVRAVMDKIGKISTDMGTVTKLYSIGTTIFSVLQSQGII